MVNEIRNHFSGVITHGNNDFIICNDTDRDSDIRDASLLLQGDSDNGQ